MKTKILYILLLPFLLWRCDNQDDVTVLPQEGEPIQFILDFADNESPKSRMITDIDFSNSWQEGDEVGVYAVKGNKGLQAENNYINNLKLTFDGTKWTPSRAIYYPNDGENLSFYAYYPFVDNSSQDPTSLIFAVEKDQRGKGYDASNLLTASKADVPKSASSRVELEFSHAMALIQIEVEKEEFVPELTDEFMVRIIFAQSEVQLNLETEISKNTTEIYSDIIMHKVEGLPQTYRALIPAQKLTQYSKVKFSQKAEGAIIDMDYLGLIYRDLKSGTVLKRKITLGREDGFEGLQQYKVGDYYPDPNVVYENKIVVSGIPAKGIVCWVNPNSQGTHGLVASLDDVKKKYWNKVNILTSATDIDNGLENMRTIEEYIKTHEGIGWSDFPAFEWVHTAKNGGNARYDVEMLNVWYIPARLELKKLYAGYSGKVYEEIIGWGSTKNMPGYNTPESIAAQAAFNEKLKAANGVQISTISSEFRHTSSSESSIGQMWSIYMTNGYTVSTGNKTSSIYTTRPMLAF